jgi:hypothetical protein
MTIVGVAPPAFTGTNLGIEAQVFISRQSRIENVLGIVSTAPGASGRPWWKTGALVCGKRDVLVALGDE